MIETLMTMGEDNWRIVVQLITTGDRRPGDASAHTDQHPTPVMSDWHQHQPLHESGTCKQIITTCLSYRLFSNNL